MHLSSVSGIRELNELDQGFKNADHDGPQSRSSEVGRQASLDRLSIFSHGHEYKSCNHDSGRRKSQAEFRNRQRLLASEDKTPSPKTGAEPQKLNSFWYLTSSFNSNFVYTYIIYILIT